jgi:hypothetical protein
MNFIVRPCILKILIQDDQMRRMRWVENVPFFRESVKSIQNFGSKTQ